MWGIRRICRCTILSCRLAWLLVQAHTGIVAKARVEVALLREVVGVREGVREERLGVAAAAEVHAEGVVEVAAEVAVEHAVEAEAVVVVVEAEEEGAKTAFLVVLLLLRLHDTHVTACIPYHDSLALSLRHCREECPLPMILPVFRHQRIPCLPVPPSLR